MSNTVSRSEPLVALTAGEPAGIGPDLLVTLAHRPLDARLVAFADPELLRQRAAALGRGLDVLTATRPEAVGDHAPGRLFVIPVPLASAARAGRPDPLNAGPLLDAVRLAAEACLSGTVDAMVTAPVSKAVINDAGIPFSGHTEFIGGICSGFPVMMLMSRTLRVVLVTTHVRLSAVSAAVTDERVRRTLAVADADLRSRFGIDKPTLLVCGLNPHAGESGHLGDEERRVLVPVMAELRRQGLRLTGPVAADTAFTPDALRGVDAVVAMYHDQGLAPLKALGFGGIVNVTLGLPIIRTSVDHGTALELAATGRARPDSLFAAVDCAIEMAARAAGIGRSTGRSAITPA